MGQTNKMSIDHISMLDSWFVTSVKSKLSSILLFIFKAKI